MNLMAKSRTRLAIVVSHPIQYYVPLYRRLAQRNDVTLKVFFTWHDGRSAMLDRGFERKVAWDIPMTQGYDHECVPNDSSDPGTHRFFGLRNPSLVERVLAWNPDTVHITGWAWLSHLFAMRAFRRAGVKTLFRGDSHLLDSPLSGLRWRLKHALLKRVYAWPNACLYVGEANRAYYAAFGVNSRRLCFCPHSIDVARFSDPTGEYEREAVAWRGQLGIAEGCPVLLFAGKFEARKRPLELMHALRASGFSPLVLVLVGGGELEGEVKALAASDPERFRVLPFQNQSRMPVVYRLGNLFVLPSAFGETWGLAVNEAMACGRPVVVSDRVGCAADLVDASCGRIFPWQDFSATMRAVNDLFSDGARLLAMGQAAARRARAFDIDATESTLLSCLRGCHRG